MFTNFPTTIKAIEKKGALSIHAKTSENFETGTNGKKQLLGKVFRN